MRSIRSLILLVWIFLTIGPGRPIELHAQPPITAVAFPPDGKTVLVGSQLGVTVLSWPGLEPQPEPQVSIATVNDIAFSPNGKQVALAGGDPAEDGQIEIIDWPVGAVATKLVGHEDSVMSVVWIDDQRVASASLDQRVIVWNANLGEQTQVLLGHSRGVSGLASIAGAEVLVSGSRDESLRVWDLTTGQLKNSLTIHTQPIHRLAVRPNQAGLVMVASASDDRTVRLWQPTLGRMVRFARLAAKPLDICWLADGSRLVAGCDNGMLYVIDPETIQITDTRHVMVDGWIYSVNAHPSDGSVLVGGSQGKIVKVDL
jgi:WD40 repeat protein